MKNKKLKLIAISFALVMVCTVLPSADNRVILPDAILVDQSEPAEVVWSYDFDDNNLSDWEIYGIIVPIPYTQVPGSFSTDDGSLRANSTGVVSSLAHVNSSVAYGTWSFDVDVVDTYNHEIVIPFITVTWDLDRWTKDCYFFQIVTGMYRDDPQPRVQAGRGNENLDRPLGKEATWLDEYPYDDILGWKSFIITRQDNGQFYVYMNGTLVLGFKDNQHTTCNQFAFGTGGGPAIDNIVVYDEVIVDMAPPEWVGEPTNKIINQSQSFMYDLDAEDFSGLGTWAINDTTNFAIDSNGVITNTTTLTLGTYGLNVSVSDTLGFTRAAVFSVTVQPLQSPAQPDLVLYAVAGVGAIVIIALVVVFMKKRG